jgi:F0F1-type ATP synthase membrane subunit b/b'
MFLQQDLRQTTTQLNDYMRAEITRTLQEEFKKYEQSIVDAKQIALDSIEKTVATIEQQRQFLEQQMKSETDAQKKHLVERFEAEMATIVNHYVQQAIGNQIDLSEQMDFILGEMQANKPAILEDIKRGST